MTPELAPASFSLPGAAARGHACPRCDAPAKPAAALQRCEKCKKPFLLVARVAAAAAPAGKPIKVTYSETALRRSATVDDAGVSCSTLDPVTGLLPMDTRKIPFTDIATIGLYRRIDWALLIALVLLFLLPVVVPLVIASFNVPVVFAFSLPCVALFGLGLKKSIGVGVQRMRVVSATQAEVVLKLRFDAPMWKRKKFVDAVLTRSGVEAAVWP